MLPEPLVIVKRLIQEFDSLCIAHRLGDEVTSAMYGLDACLQDLDFVADIKENDVTPFVAALAEEFYVDDKMVLDAITTQSSFSVIHLSTTIKADVFIKTSDLWKEAEWARRRLMPIGSGDEALTVQVASPEDLILQKLVWFRLGGGVSTHQWSDVTGVLKVQARALDFVYLRRWAAELGLSELLRKALDDAGLEETPADAEG
jgi:hypothetical protein